MVIIAAPTVIQVSRTAIPARVHIIAHVIIRLVGAITTTDATTTGVGTMAAVTAAVTKFANLNGLQGPFFYALNSLLRCMTATNIPPAAQGFAFTSYSVKL